MNKLLLKIKKSIEEEINEELKEFLKKVPVAKNWFRSIKAKTALGILNLEIPRTRWKKWEWNIFYSDIKWNYIEDLINEIIQRILVLMKVWNTFEDIKTYFKEWYWFSFSNNLLSKIYNSIYDQIIEWRSKTLSEFYSIFYLDATFIKLKVFDQKSNKNTIKSVPVYFIIWVNLEWEKEILDFVILENPENSYHWQEIINNLYNRWVKDVLIACMDWLPGLKEAFLSVFPNTEIQHCIVHKVRNIHKLISFKDRDEFFKEFKSVYNSNSMEEAELVLNKMKTKWDKYSSILDKWLYDIDEWWNYFKYSRKIRTLIYTTNIIENWNWIIKANISKRRVYFTNKSVQISIFLAIMHKKDKLKKIRDCNEIRLELIWIFWDRIPKN